MQFTVVAVALVSASASLSFTNIVPWGIVEDNAGWIHRRHMAQEHLQSVRAVRQAVPQTYGDDNLSNLRATKDTSVSLHGDGKAIQKDTPEMREHVRRLLHPGESKHHHHHTKLEAVDHQLKVESMRRWLRGEDAVPSHGATAETSTMFKAEASRQLDVDEIVKIVKEGASFGKVGVVIEKSEDDDSVFIEGDDVYEKLQPSDVERAKVDVDSTVKVLKAGPSFGKVGAVIEKSEDDELYVEGDDFYEKLLSADVEPVEVEAQSSIPPSLTRAEMKTEVKIVSVSSKIVSSDIVKPNAALVAPVAVVMNSTFNLHSNLQVTSSSVVQEK